MLELRIPNRGIQEAMLLLPNARVLNVLKLIDDFNRNRQNNLILHKREGFRNSWPRLLRAPGATIKCKLLLDASASGQTCVLRSRDSVHRFFMLIPASERQTRCGATGHSIRAV